LTHSVHEIETHRERIQLDLENWEKRIALPVLWGFVLYRIYSPGGTPVT
jgi:hypothetical protein